MSNRKNKSNIKTLKDLRLAKRKIKLQMKYSENKHENSFVNKAANFVSGLRSDSQLTALGVENTLNWFGNRAFRKYPKNGFSKFIISGLIMVAVPIITKKIQEYIEDKF